MPISPASPVHPAWRCVGVALAALMLVASVACARDAEAPRAAREGGAVQDAATPAPTRPRPSDMSSEATAADAATRERRRAAMRESVSVVHQYLQRVSQREFEQADALWAYRRSPGPGEESGLRALGDVRVMRIDNDPPVALDDEPVPATVEVPVRLLATLPDNRQARFTGHYRVRRNPVEGRWELTGASLQPVLR